MWAEALEGRCATLAEIGTAYRRFAQENPQLYRLMTDRPLPRDLLPEGLEARAAAPFDPRRRRSGPRAGPSGPSRTAWWCSSWPAASRPTPSWSTPGAKAIDAFSAARAR